MAKAVYRYRAQCADDLTGDPYFHYLYDVVAPKSCPLNIPTHKFVGSVIVETVKSNDVILTADNEGVAGYYGLKGYSLNVAAGPDTEYQDLGEFHFDVPVRISEVMLYPDTNNSGDFVSIHSIPNTLAGTLAQSVSSGNILNVSSEVLQVVSLGFLINLDDGVTVFNCGMITSINEIGETITVQNNISGTFGVGTEVLFSIARVIDLPIVARSLIRLGNSNIGSTYIPTGYITKICQMKRKILCSRWSIHINIYYIIYVTYQMEEGLIEQIIMVGSPQLAIETGVVTAKNILEYLVKKEENILTYIAYDTICQLLTVKDQYLPSYEHFLYVKPNYIAIGEKYDFNMALRINTLPRTSRLINSLFNMIDYNDDLLDFLSGNMVMDNMCKARIYKNGMTNENFCNADWFENFIIDETLGKACLLRIEYLMSNAFDYFTEIVYQKYRNTIAHLYNNNLLRGITKTHIHMIDNIYPGLIDKRILKYKDSIISLFFHDENIKSYFLGFDIHKRFPFTTEINKKFVEFEKVGAKSYVEHLKKQTEKTYEGKKINNTNVLFENIENYYEFDIIDFEDNGYTFRFTRPEFPAIIETGRNPWTNESLPPHIIQKIKSRIYYAERLGLPNSRPMIEIIRQLKK